MKSGALAAPETLRSDGCPRGHDPHFVFLDFGLCCFGLGDTGSFARFGPFAATGAERSV